MSGQQQTGQQGQQQGAEHQGGQQGTDGQQGQQQGQQGAPQGGQQQGGQQGQQQRPDGITEAEWSALGDPGRAAIVREREARRTAERELARRSAPQGGQQGHQGGQDAQQGQQGHQGGHQGADGQQSGQQGQPGQQGGQDIGALITQAVAAAMAPFQQAQQQRETQDAARAVLTAVEQAAEGRFHDPTDALAHVDVAALTDGNGRPDQQKVQAALADLLTRKPHLGKPEDTRRQAAAGSGHGAGMSGPAAGFDDLVKAELELMQKA